MVITLNGKGKYLLLLLSLHVGTALAETVYVQDHLRLGVRSAPDATGTSVAVVATGDALQVLEETDEYLRIRTGEGVDGWVSKAYVSPDVPAVLRLEKLQASFSKQQDELKKLGDELADKTRLDESLEKQRAELSAENDALQQRLAKYEDAKGSLAWLYRTLAIAGLFLFGIFLGVRWQKRRIAERLGGFEL